MRIDEKGAEFMRKNKTQRIKNENSYDYITI